MKQDFLSLEKLSEHSAYREGFLLEKIRQGKLKAFKVGDGWFSNKEWLGEYEAKIKTELAEAVFSDDLHDKSVFVREESLRVINFFVPKKFALISLGWFLIVAVALIFYVDQPKTAHYIIINAGNIADQELAVVGAPYRVIKTFVSLLVKNSRQVKFTYQKDGQLATVKKNRADGIKISDEVITEIWHDFWTEKKAQVAGVFEKLE